MPNVHYSNSGKPNGDAGGPFPGKKSVRRISELMPLGLSPHHASQQPTYYRPSAPSPSSFQAHALASWGPETHLRAGPTAEILPGFVAPSEDMRDFSDSEHYTRHAIMQAGVRNDGGALWTPALASQGEGNAVVVAPVFYERPTQNLVTNVRAQANDDSHESSVKGGGEEAGGHFRKRAPPGGIRIDGQNFGSGHKSMACDKESAATATKEDSAKREKRASIFQRNFPILSSIFSRDLASSEDKPSLHQKRLQRIFPEEIARRLRPKKRISVHGCDFGSSNDGLPRSVSGLGRSGSEGSFRRQSLFRIGSRKDSYQERYEAVSNRKTSEKGHLMINEDYTRQVETTDL